MHNREYWYKRVRMPFNKGAVASAGLLSILEYLKSDDVFKQYITVDLEKHFTNWARRCRGGRFEPVPEIDMYSEDGVDSDGLTLWLRNTGTKAENYHQKLNAGTGPFCMGVETGHYYHLLLSYMYLVNSKVRREGEPDFGHWRLDVEDRIQVSS